MIVILNSICSPVNIIFLIWSYSEVHFVVQRRNKLDELPTLSLGGYQSIQGNLWWKKPKFVQHNSI